RTDMLKRRSNLLTTSFLLLCVTGIAAAQQNRVYREGNNWGQEVNGSLSGARNIRVHVAFGDVRVQGGSQQGINYSFRSLAYTSSEDKARREFNSYKLNAYVHGDTAYIVADAENAHHRKCSGELVVNVPREMDSVKIETDGGNIAVNSISGQLGAETGGGS